MCKIGPALSVLQGIQSRPFGTGLFLTLAHYLLETTIFSLEHLRCLRGDDLDTSASELRDLTASEAPYPDQVVLCLMVIAQQPELSGISS